MIDFKKLAKEYKTPLYVYDLDYMTTQYEQLKDAFLKRYRRETAEQLRMAKAKELGKDSNKTQQASDYMRNCLDEFTTNNGGIDVPKIMSNFGVGQSAARIAYKMASMPRNELDVKKGQKKMKDAKKKHISWYDGTKLDN